MVSTLLAILTCYRITRLITKDDGPGFIILKFRQFFAEKAGKDLANKKENSFWISLDEGINCPFCIGFWIAVGMGLWVEFAGIESMSLFLVIFGIMGGQAVIQEFINKGETNDSN